MATFTIQLRTVDKCHNVTKSALMQYPIWDEGYRIGLNSKILQHYWLEEIAYETPDLFLFSLRRKMNEIMPYYNKLYESEQFEFDPMSTIDLSTLNDGHNVSRSDSEGQSKVDSSTNAKNRSVSSDFPQTMLKGDGDYASSAADSVGETIAETGTSDSNVSRGTGTHHAETRQKGRVGHGSELLSVYRANLLNIDMMVIDDLKGLFMALWGIADNFPDEPSYYHPYY